jgi:hypothetical protein
LQSGDLNLLKLSGTVQACNGIALPFTLKVKRAEAEITACLTQEFMGLYQIGYTFFTVCAY